MRKIKEKDLNKLVITLTIVLLALIVVTTYLYVMKTKDTEIKTYTLDTGNMYCNIKDSKKILSVTVVIESINEKSTLKMQEELYKVRDEINKTIRDKTQEELSFPGYTVEMSLEIKERLKEVFKDESITNIYFSNYITGGI